MIDEHDPFDEPSPDEVSAVGELLGRAEVWDDPPSAVEDAVVAEIASEAAAAATELTAVASERAGVTRAPARRLRTSAPWWLAAAAALAVVVTGAALLVRGGEAEQNGVAVALEPSGDAGEASATAHVSSTPAGLRIVLDVDGLPAAPPDSFYEAWLSDGRTSVSCGTFHLRDGDEPIALWAGVADPAFDRLAVTLEPLDGDAGSSGDVRFAGRIDFTGIDDRD